MKIILRSTLVVEKYVMVSFVLYGSMSSYRYEKNVQRVRHFQGALKYDFLSTKKLFGTALKQTASPC